MSTITTIQSTDLITNSRADINTNFANLNSDKIETSVIDTDTTLAANSDAKIPSQKAVKAYVDTGGNVNASETTKGIVEEATDAEVTAGTATGGTGAKLFVTPAKLATRINALALNVKVGAATRDISAANGTQTIAHGLGTTPTLVKISGGVAGASGFSSTGTLYFNSTQYSWYSSGDTGSGTVETAGATFTMKGLDNADCTGTVTVDSTNISIAWVKTGSPTGTAYMIWEVYK